jgi:nucleotide-binding universal stress UspA family protein
MPEKTILVPLDGSAESEAALRYAVLIASAEHAGLRLVTVIDTQFAYLFTGSEPPVADWTERQRTQADHYLGAQAETLRKRGLDVSSTVLLGDPSQEILREADAIAASMVVTATHGRGGLQRWALGSVADKLMRLGGRLTLLVRPPEVPDTGELALRRLMVPLDGSAAAQAAIEPAVELAEATGAELVLVRVEEWVSTTLTRWGGEGAYIPNLAELEEETTEMVESYLAEVRQRVPSSVACQAVALRGMTIPELEGLLAERHIDLVLMTTHGRGGLSRFVLGSTADRLVRDGVPALLLPLSPPDGQAERRTPASS